MVNIRPSAAIRKNYNEISNLCKQTKEPVFLTKNGEGDLVVMDLETFAHRERMLRLREILLQSDADILSGRVRSVEETAAAMRLVITEAVNAGV
jgi:PHD/YefM family antitoxin component YafN of YafNO toxin-antitoxin module